MFKVNARVISLIMIVSLFLVSLSLYINGKSLKIIDELNVSTDFQNADIEYIESEKLLILANYNNEVVGYQEGVEKWRTKLNGVASDMKVYLPSNQLYIGSEDGNVYVINLQNGNLETTINIGYRVYSIDISEKKQLILISAGASVINHRIFLMDLSSKLIWKKDIGILAKTAIFNNESESIVIGTNRAEVIMYNLQGEETKKVKIGYQIERLYIEEDNIIALTADNIILELDNRGTTIGKVELNDGGFTTVVTTPNKESGFLVIGDEDGLVSFLNDDNKVIFEYNLGSKIVGIKSSIDKTYIQPLKGTIVSIDNDKLIHLKNNAKIALYLKAMQKVLIVSTIFSLLFSIKRLKRSVIEIITLIYANKTAYFMLLPTFVLILLFAYVPIFTAITRAFTDWNMFSNEINFNGVDNFIKMIDEGYFLSGIFNLLLMIAFNLLKYMTVPFIAAELVYHLKSNRGKYLSRLLFVVPMVVPMVVTALMWQNIYDPNIGLLNKLLEIFGLEQFQHVWLGDKKTALGAIIFMGFPFIDAFAFLVYYGGLLNIPLELFEAAKIDGSNGYWNLLYIHIPLVSPQFKIIIMLQFISTIQNFAPILILTGGGPGTSTYVPGLELYYNATVFGNYGYACALGLVMFIAIAIVTFINSRIKTTLDD